MRKSDIRVGVIATLVNYKCRFNDGMIVTVKEILPNDEYLVKDIYEKPHVVKARNLTED